MVASADFNFAPPPAQLLSPPIWKAFFPNDTMSSAYLELLKDTRSRREVTTGGAAIGRLRHPRTASARPCTVIVCQSLAG